MTFINVLHAVLAQLSQSMRNGVHSRNTRVCALRTHVCMHLIVHNSSAADEMLSLECSFSETLCCANSRRRAVIEARIRVLVCLQCSSLH
jgi:hypothetical protein